MQTKTVNVDYEHKQGWFSFLVDFKSSSISLRQICTEPAVNNWAAHHSLHSTRSSSDRLFNVLRMI